MFSVSRLSYFYLIYCFYGLINSFCDKNNGANTNKVRGEAATYGGGGVGRLIVLANKDGSGIIKGEFSIIILVFGVNLLKRSLNIIGGNTRSNNTLTKVVVLIRDLRGIYLT